MRNSEKAAVAEQTRRNLAAQNVRLEQENTELREALGNRATPRPGSKADMALEIERLKEELVQTQTSEE